MIKSIIKEVFIIILLIVAIILVLGIIFYEYIPTTKTIPSIVAEYNLPEEMVEELDKTVLSVERQKVVQSYSVDSSDLERYEAIDSYDKGKANPFELISTSIDNNNSSGGIILNNVK